MKKTILTSVAMLFLSISQIFAQENQEVKHESVQYYFFTNNIPSDWNYPLIGFVNNVNGNHASIQVGIVNSTTGNFGGLQSGFVNSVGGNVTGIQNGFINSVGEDVKGIQSGFINSDASDFSGIQSGFINSVGESYYGIQSGFINRSSNVTGIQTGFINSTGTTVKGVQCGFINSSDEIRGLQYGFINSAKSLSGLQLGFINSVDHVEKGLPIGFLSFVKHGGYKAIEFSYTDLHPYNLAFKTGIRQLYTFPMVSWNPELADKVFIGYGVGSNLDLGQRLFFNPELLSQHNISLDFNHFLSLKTNLGLRLSDWFEIVAGPTLVWNVKIDADDFHQNYIQWDPDIISVNNLSVGFNIAARFCF